mgnify:CR=1 FL=1
MMYQIQYLQMFGLTEFDENVVGKKLDTLYTQLEKEPFLEELFDIHPYAGQMCKQIMFRTLFWICFIKYCIIIFTAIITPITIRH